MRLLIVLPFALIALQSAALAKSPTVRAEPASLDHAIRVGAVLPDSAQIIAQPNNAFGIVIEQSRVLVVDPKTRKVVEILESGA